MLVSNWIWAGICCAMQAGRIAAQSTTVPDYFNGYYIHLHGTTTATDSITCETTMSWAGSGDHGNCCQTTSTGVRCPMPTACVDRTVWFDDDSSYTCAPGQDCATMTVFQTLPFGLPSTKQAFCWQAWEAHTVYRELPSTTATTTGSDPSSTASEGSKPGAPTASETGAHSTSSTVNQGLIAGVVVGPVVGVALAAFGLWFGYRQAKKARQMQAIAPPYDPFSGDGHVQPVPPHMQRQSYIELDSQGIYQKP